MLKKTAAVLVMIKIEHTVFALPFAVIGMFYAAKGFPGWWTVGWVVGAMVGARSPAMTFNRIVDRKIDAENPRTRDRPIPRGKIKVGFAVGFTVVMSALFFVSAGMLNTLCLALSPVALIVITGYSYTKRWTSLCHFALGLGLAMAPVGAWLAVSPEFHPVPLLFAGAVLFWVAGFDIIYATLDLEFDRKKGIHSIPAKIGTRNALLMSAFLHALTVICLFVVGGFMDVGWYYLGGCAGIALLLIYEHSIVRPDDLGKVNRAFFTVNGIVSVLLMAAAISDLYL